MSEMVTTIDTTPAPTPIPASVQEGLQRNVALIAAAMTAVGIDTLTARYAGSGDSGEIESIEVGVGEVASAAADDRLDTAHLWQWFFRGYGAWAPVAEQVKGEWRWITLRNAITQATEDTINASGNDGYENGDGGEGEFVVTSAGSATLEHSNFYLERDTSTFEFGVQVSEESAVLVLPPADAQPAMLLQAGG